MHDTSQEATDEELMQAYARGGAEAFDQLFDRYRRPLFTYLLHHTGSRDVAEDLFQEVFLRLIRGREKYARVGTFRSWLYTIAHNAMTDGRRRSAVRNAMKTDGAIMNASDGDATNERWDERLPSRDEGGDPVSTTHRNDLQDRIEAALLKIPAAQREVFLLRVRAGMEFQSVARVTGCRLATVKSRMRYALANLRRCLSEELPSLSECRHE